MTQEKQYYDITNRFVFARVFSDPENARPLLEAVMGVKIREIRYVEAEHGVEPSLRGRGVRMDVFVDDADGTVYDVEMQNKDEGNLALRSRYLLSAFDRDRIGRGEPYVDLKRTVVIFVCRFDPLGLGRRAYAVRPMVEGADVPFDDGTLRVFLNAAGAAEEVRESHGKTDQLSEFLSYVDGGGTMGNGWLERIDRNVQSLNGDEGWRETVLSFESMVEEEKALARKKGLEEGHKKGLDEGHKKGLEEGRKEGRELGLEEGRKEGARTVRLEAARAMMEALSCTAQHALELLDIPEEERPGYLAMLEG